MWCPIILIEASAFSIDLQQISCYCHWISLRVQVMKLQKALWQTAVLIFYSSLFITASVLAWIVWKIKSTTAVQIRFQRKNPSLRILTARPLRMLGILNVRTIIFLFRVPFATSWILLMILSLFVFSQAVDRVDVEGNAPSGLVVRLPFASLFDTLGM